MLGSLKGWFTALSITGKIGVIGVSVVGLGTAGAISVAQHPNTPMPVKASKVEHKTVTTTEAIAFDVQTVDDSSLSAGVDKVINEGVNGVKTKTFDVTYTNGQESARKLIKEEITTKPIAKIVHHGTYVGTAKSTSNSSTTRSTVAPHGPPGPETYTKTGGARCNDGYDTTIPGGDSTCYSHGGVQCYYYTDGSCRPS